MFLSFATKQKQILSLGTLRRIKGGNLLMLIVYLVCLFIVDNYDETIGEISVVDC